MRQLCAVVFPDPAPCRAEEPRAPFCLNVNSVIFRVMPNTCDLHACPSKSSATTCTAARLINDVTIKPFSTLSGPRSRRVPSVEPKVLQWYAVTAKSWPRACATSRQAPSGVELTLWGTWSSSSVAGLVVPSHH